MTSVNLLSSLNNSFLIQLLLKNTVFSNKQLDPQSETVQITAFLERHAIKSIYILRGLKTLNLLADKIISLVWFGNG